ncbi:MAG: hypothetical protein WA888_06060 [Burkholderiaceae bacterium]
MGRPLGAPHEQAQQTRVLRSALNLLERTDGPVILDDFPEEAPRATAQEMDGMFCPLPAARPAAAAEGDLMAAVTAEVGSLRPWHVLAQQRQQGRTTVGSSGLSLDDALGFLGQVLQGQDPSLPNPALDAGQTLRLSALDLRTWYLEAAVARPGANPSSVVMSEWFWGETAAGQLLLAIYDAATDHPNRKVRREAKLTLIPRREWHRLNTVP